MKADARAREATNNAYAGRLHQKMSGSGVAGRGDAVGPFPDIAKQVVFKIEKLTERVHRPKAPATLLTPTNQLEMCHLMARRREKRTLRSLLAIPLCHHCPRHRHGGYHATETHRPLPSLTTDAQISQKILSIQETDCERIGDVKLLMVYNYCFFYVKHLMLFSTIVCCDKM